MKNLTKIKTVYKIYIFYYISLLLTCQLFAFFIKSELKFQELIFVIIFLMFHILMFYRFKINNIKISLSDAKTIFILNFIFNILAFQIYSYIVRSMYNFEIYTDGNLLISIAFPLIISTIYILVFRLIYNRLCTI